MYFSTSSPPRLENDMCQIKISMVWCRFTQTYFHNINVHLYLLVEAVLYYLYDTAWPLFELCENCMKKWNKNQWTHQYLKSQLTWYLQY